jgi:hypothetical protein
LYERLNNFHFQTNIIKMIKLGGYGRGTKHYVKREMHTKFWSLILKERDRFRDLVIDRNC